jgi:hypothetical protein
MTLMMTNRLANRRLQRGPDFLAGVLTEPLLAFGGSHEHVDPKTGLALYGPYCSPGLARPALSTIIVGAVGPARMVADAAAWIEACRGIVTNSGTEPYLYPHFPGCRQDLLPFFCDLLFRDQWCETIKDAELQRALAQPIFEDRLMAVIDLYLAGVETLHGREPQPNVVLLCLPQEVVDRCAVAARGDPRMAPPKRPAKKLEQRQYEMFPEPEIDDEGEFMHRNLRRGFKARAMRYGIPTQIVWPRTLNLVADEGAGRGSRRSQDAATRAWNLITALYHKAGGIPWRLRHVDPGVCFVGISFYREINEVSPRLRTSIAQTFTASGDGYVLRGSTFEWDERDHGRSPHLDGDAAQSLVRDVLELYKRQNRGSLPTRLVLHKRSRFWNDELEGFQSGAEQVPQVDLLALGERGIRFFRPGDFPPLRGTYVKFSDQNFLLYTTGFMPYLRTYPGARIPQPTEVLEHHGDSPWDRVLAELLSLTKLNWNSADFAARYPITLAFSGRVGEILAEMPEDAPFRPEYRFYM